MKAQIHLKMPVHQSYYFEDAAFVAVGLEVVVLSVSVSAPRLIKMPRQLLQQRF